MAGKTLALTLLGVDKWSSMLGGAGKSTDKFTGQVGRSGEQAGKSWASKMKAAAMGGIKDIGAGLVAGLGAAAIGKLAMDSIKSASDLSEAVSKTNVVFGKGSKVIHDWASTAASSMGLSTSAAETAAGTLGNLFVSMKIGQGDAAKMSTSMVKLAGDLASFNNVSPEEALDALRSGLVGETEPLRAFGVNLSAAAISAEGLRLGLVKGAVDMTKVGSARATLAAATEKLNKMEREGTASAVELGTAKAAVARAEDAVKKAMGGSIPEMNAAQKAQAAYSLIMAQTTTAQGDFARTSGGLANQQRILTAKFEDTKAAIGAQLLPMMVGLVSWANGSLVPAIQSVVTWMGKNQGTVKLLGMALGSLLVAIVGLKTSMLVYSGVLKVTAASTAIWNGAARLSSSIALGTRVQLGLLTAQTLLTSAASKAAAVGVAIQNTAMALSGKLALGSRIQLALLTATTIAAGVASKVFAAGVWLVNVAMRANPIGIVITILVALVAAIVLAYNKSETFRKIVQAAWQGVVTVVKWAWNNVIFPIFKLVLNYYVMLGKAALWLYDHGVKPAWTLVVTIIKTSFTIISGIFNKLKTFVMETIPNAFKTGVAAIGRFWSKVQDLARKPVAFIVNTVYNNGIRKVWNWVASKVGLGQLDEIKGFKTGGPITKGKGPKSDDQLIRASKGEFMINAASVQRNLGLIDYINRRGRNKNVLESIHLAGNPGGPNAIPGFAEGGIIGWVKSFGAKAKEWFMEGLVKAGRAVLNPIVGLVRGTIGGTPLGSMLATSVETLAGGMLDSFKPLESRMGGPGAKAVAQARSQIGVPYVWGGTAWGRGLDCSALVQGAWQRAVGHGGMPRTTYTQWPWLEKIGTRPQRPGDVGQPHPGHTFIYTGKGTIIEEPYTGASGREVPVRSANWGRPPANWVGSADSGVATLAPGMNMVHNGTGRRETLTAGGNTYNINLYAAPGADLSKAGKQIVDCIVAFESQSGKRWRR
jgi:hypothetical protein